MRFIEGDVFDLELAKARKNLAEFLAENPRLQSFQDDLEQAFKDHGNDPEENMNIIKMAMITNMIKMSKIRRAFNGT